MFVLFAYKMADNLRGSSSKELILSTLYRCLLVKWKVSANQKVSKGSILAVYKKINPNFSGESDLIVLPKLKSDTGGLIKKLLVAEGEEVEPGQAVILLDVCEHKTIMKDMCAECGADLRREPGIPGNLKEPVSASVALVHNIPELRVSQEEAEVLAKKDKEVLLQSEKLVLVVDLDQTLIHTTTENVPADMKDICHFQLYGQSCWYHTKFRPGWKEFLEDMKKYYELHIFTMGSRMYAHTIARMLDPTGELFADRIRSRDESFDMFSKYRDLSALFPCDDSMVCIIDDREDIWDCAPNLITVKPYRFFTGTGDINAPPGSDQAFTHPSVIPLHESPADAKLKNKVDDDESAEKMDENHAPVEMDIAKQVVATDIPNKDSSNDTVAIQSVSENFAPVETSMVSAVERGAASEINHILDEQDIARKSESGGAREPVNGSSMETLDTTKHDLEESFGTVKREACDGCETVLTVTAVTEEFKDKSENASRNLEREESEEFQETNKTREEIVEPGNEKDAARGETGENLGDRSAFQASAGAEDGVRKECEVSEHGAQKESENNIVNDKGNKGAPAKGTRDDDDDDYLLYLDEILRRIHRRFYEILSAGKNTESGDTGTGGRVENRADLRSIVPELRQSVLKGANLVFTGVIPTNCRHEESQAWKIATQFGAGVTRELMTRKNTPDKSLRTSHVIAARPGTEKACQALRMPNVNLVNPNWLWTCAERWEWVDERLFPVEDAREYKSWRNETPPSACGRFQDALNPLLSFSSGEVEAMDKEVEDLMRSSDGEEEGEEEGEIFGSVSSSSGTTANGRSSAASGGSLRMGTESDGADGADGADEDKDVIQGKAVDFSTIKQAAKRRSVDFCDDVKAKVKKAKIDANDDEANEEPGLESSNEDTSSGDGSSGEDGDDNDMAAMLEAALSVAASFDPLV